MKCPKLVHTRDQELGLRISFFGDCIKEECAWWDHDRNICVVKSIFHDLTNIRIELREIKDKMPHEEQSRK